MRKKKSTAEFVSEAVKKHGGRYDYSNTKYVASNAKVSVLCLVDGHGEFFVTPNNHLKGSGCPKCYGTPKLSKDDFVAKATKIHGDIYDYSFVEYRGNKAKVDILCKKHGLFSQKPNSHLSGSGCPSCALENSGNGLKLSYKDFIDRAITVHGNKYDYSRSEYKGSHTKLIVTCPEHGDFSVKPNNHIRNKSGCPLCAVSGFKRYGDGILYLIRFGKYVGFGITKSEEKRLKTHKRNIEISGLSVTSVITYKSSASDVFNIERKIKSVFKTRIVDSRIDGFRTECLLESDYHLLIDFVEHELDKHKQLCY